jgi:hypothetical protein
VTSAEVLEEPLLAYLPVQRIETLDAALTLAEAHIAVVWPVERNDVVLARALMARHPALGARGLLHLACCMRREVAEIQTFNRALGAAFTTGAPREAPAKQPASARAAAGAEPPLQRRTR